MHGMPLSRNSLVSKPSSPADAQECSDQSWHARYQQLVRWHQRSGHCLVPKGTGTLGRWVSRQRELFKKKSLGCQRVQKLAALGFVWDANEAAFQARVNELLLFKKKHGHLRVPSTFPRLGMWVAKMRTRYRREELPPERVDALNHIGFVWSPEQAEWLEKYNELSYFHQNYGSPDVFMSQKQYYGLALWCSIQRQEFHRGKLHQSRVQLLNTLQFKWHISPPPVETFPDVTADLNTCRTPSMTENQSRTSISSLCDLWRLPAADSQEQRTENMCTSISSVKKDTLRSVAYPNRLFQVSGDIGKFRSKGFAGCTRHVGFFGGDGRIPSINNFYHIVNSRIRKGF